MRQLHPPRRASFHPKIGRASNCSPKQGRDQSPHERTRRALAYALSDGTAAAGAGLDRQNSARTSRRPSRDTYAFSEPYRLEQTFLSAGDVTKQMAVPWQTATHHRRHGVHTRACSMEGWC